ncbi:hypothetical protein [Gordonia polyisoprenivorans]|uniref:hypothetical protein n=1 Tax=Gordonia polyisoprenivorans TaxID=84595 RepID=UPI001AD7C7D1|nr:hypothetical protein [Gordonia polyisoprenivorans]QTI69613.1 hypothetical protein J6U32_03090 [Gordonia polyisoprenivorans]
MATTIVDGSLNFSFPEIDQAAILHITFHRTLRVPDDATTYGLPPGLGEFDLRQVGERNDVIMPMWQAEASWIGFSSPTQYPFLIKVGVGGVNAITGDPYSPVPDFGSEDYLESDTQPWLDGFRVDDTTVRQFVAMPLGTGYTVAEQLSGKDTGTIEFSVVPIKAEVWAQREVIAPPTLDFCACPPADGDGMGFGAGGSIKQSIATPLESHDNWCDTAQSSATVKIVNSTAWQTLTDEPPHHPPLTIDEYRAYGYPWFAWYDDSLARQGESPFASARTVKHVGDSLCEQPLPDNPTFTPPTPIVLGPRI